MVMDAMGKDMHVAQVHGVRSVPSPKNKIRAQVLGMAHDGLNTTLYDIHLYLILGGSSVPCIHVAPREDGCARGSPSTGSTERW